MIDPVSSMTHYSPIASMLPSQPSRSIIVPPQIESSSSRAEASQKPASTKPAETAAGTARSQITPDRQALSQDNNEAMQRQIEQVVAQLRARDREVRAHEQAHVAAAGAYATSGIKYSYQSGPDGQRYAIGGSVSIDTSPVPGDPQATLLKAQVVQRAALAPAQPSSQDMKVAAQAGQMMMQAQREIMQQDAETQSEEASQTGDERGNEPANPSDSGGSETQSEPPSIMTKSNPARQAFDLRLALQQPNLLIDQAAA